MASDIDFANLTNKVKKGSFQALGMPLDRNG